MPTGNALNINYEEMLIVNSRAKETNFLTISTVSLDNIKQ